MTRQHSQLLAGDGIPHFGCFVLTGSRHARAIRAISNVPGLQRAFAEEALRGGQVGGTIIPPVSGITDIIYYDGWSVTVGKKAYTYDGITEGLCYLIRPKRGFKSLQKQDLMVQATMGDLTTLTESQIVADFWHGVYAAVGNNAQEVTIAAS
jgi:hypothetical protein